MAYTKTTWANSPATTSPLGATNLNKIETGLFDQDARITVVEADKVDTADIVNDLTTGGTTVPLSAEQGKVLESGVLKSKIITITRDTATASGDVSYTGVGFTPSSIIAFSAVDGTVMASWGMSDSAKTNVLIEKDVDANWYTTTAGNFLIYNQRTSGAITKAIVKSYDADGFTLTWTKVLSPTGTLICKLICYR